MVAARYDFQVDAWRTYVSLEFPAVIDGQEFIVFAVQYVDGKVEFPRSGIGVFEGVLIEPILQREFTPLVVIGEVHNPLFAPEIDFSIRQ